MARRPHSASLATLLRFPSHPDSFRHSGILDEEWYARHPDAKRS